MDGEGKETSIPITLPGQTEIDKKEQDGVMLFNYR
jgi:hypothetical protein